MCQKEPDHLRGGVGADRIGVGPDRAASGPRVPAAVHRPRLCEDDVVVDVGVHRAGARAPGGPRVQMRRVAAIELSAVASRAATMFLAFTGATILSRSPWNTINGSGPPGPGDLLSAWP